LATLTWGLDPCSEEATGKAMLREAGKFAELVELAAVDDVTYIRHGDTVADVFVADPKFFHVIHV